MLCNTSTRLRLLTRWYSKLEGLVCHKMEGDWARLLGRMGIAAALSTFILGWDETEFGRVLEWAREMEPGLGTDYTRVLRIYFRELIDHEDTKASWLSFILSSFPISSFTTAVGSAEHRAANLLVLLLGPAEMDQSLLSLAVQDYNFFQRNLLIKMQCRPCLTVMDDIVPATYAEAKEIFSDLGMGLKLLLRSSDCSRSVASIMDAIFEDKKWMGWEVDNIAGCLLFSCEAVVKLYLAV